MTVDPRPGAESPDGAVPADWPTDPGPYRHHDAPVRRSIPGIGQTRAYWVDETTLAWPVDLLPHGVTPSMCVGPGGGPPRSAPPVSFGLVASPDGQVRVENGMLHRGSRGFELSLVLTGEVAPEVVAAHPQLAGYLALTTADEFGAPRLGREDVEALLTGQLAVVQRTTVASGGWLTAFTGVQIWPVIDRFWGRAASARDGSAPLGVRFVEVAGAEPGDAGGAAGPDGAAGAGSDAGAPGSQAASGPGSGDGRTVPAGDALPAFALWAPTALAVTLLAWETGDATGSAPLVDGPPARLPACRCDDGRWEVGEGRVGAGAQYLWEVEVFVPSTGRIELNLVTDPYSTALTLDSRRSVAVDLNQRALKPSSWCENLNPVVDSDAARVIYELHMRDFSAIDASVPPELRGTYAAFTVDSVGTRHLGALVSAGIDTLHLLPIFDIASVPENRADQQVPEIPVDASAASRRPQAAVTAVADRDAYSWGYDPYHWMAPEGSYAREGRQDGGARTREVREMVGALHGMGLQVVLDQVYNHTAAAGQDRYSVLDRIVPGYYHRLDADGAVEMSTCHNNVATERAMAERLMIDACVAWVRHYRVDGFRFGLMGYHSVGTMARLREALEEVAEDAVGHPIYLYGEGWHMGEVDDNVLFRQASQGQLGELGIGTFNDRVRDAVHGGSVEQPDPRTDQGLGSGEVTDPNALESRREDASRRDLAWRSDLMRLSLAGNLREFTLLTSDGHWRRGEEIGYGDSPAAYGVQPADSIAYVSSHNDETLFDRLAYKLPLTTSMADRVRMNTLCLAAVTLGQSPAFWAAGCEMLRSKSLDADSRDSGDHFNAIDWTGRDNGWGRGLPPADRNFESWIIQADLLARDELRPTTHDIAVAQAQALDLLRLRRSTPLFSLGSAELIRERVSFPVCGPQAQPGVIVMVIDDGAGEADVDPALDGVVVVLNATPHEISQRVDALVGRFLVLSDVQAGGADPVVRETRFDPATGTMTVPARTVAVLVEP
ncbi:pullulanase-type alpha-1,6-glucosidase [Actinomyces israelii]|uniref:pullulanase-type alpha-1,6-glucosidase n=1 Tax=Actinomyces israelii TaxID=1659 RepID=UPI0025564D8B|nr:pullulanase-type alpha-1,6-glucosidase [Actinomyces israelii]WKR20286.1 Glycogen debranching enzyme [Actinomyces israelii]